MFTVIHFLKMLLQIEMFWNECSVEERKPSRMELDKLQLNVCVTNTIRLDSTHYWQNTITDCGISKCTGCVTHAQLRLTYLFMAVGNHLLLITMESVWAPPKHSSYYKTLLVHTTSDLKALALGLWKWEVISDFNFISGRSNQVCPCEFRLLLHSLKRPFRALAVRAPPFCDFAQRANICWGMNQIQTCSPGFFLKFDSFIQQNNLSKVNLSLWSSICPVVSERGYWKNRWHAYLHVSVGTLKTGEVFGHTYHWDNYLPPTLPYCNCSPD